MICPFGGLPIARHNEIRDITAQWLNEVCADVVKEHHFNHSQVKSYYHA